MYKIKTLSYGHWVTVREGSDSGEPALFKNRDAAQRVANTHAKAYDQPYRVVPA